MFSTIKELVALATEQKKPIFGNIMIEQEMEMTQQSRVHSRKWKTYKRWKKRGSERCVLSSGLLNGYDT